MKTKPFTVDEWEKDTTQKVVTRDGHDVRVLCTDAKRDDFPVVALVNLGGLDFPMNFTKGGRYTDTDIEVSYDLMLVE